MNSNYNLIQEVIKKSVSKNWQFAVLEWRIIGCSVDRYLRSDCICGKENIKYLFTIENCENGEILYPIGSSCIKKFERNDLDDLVNVYEKMSRLLEEYENKKFIELNGELFSRKLIYFLYTEGCFKPNQYNHFEPENDYNFLINMFNKRSKITENQDKKIKAIIVNYVIPYIKNKIKYNN